MPTNIRLSGAQTSFRSEADIRRNYSNTTQIIAASNAVAVGTLGVFYSSDSAPFGLKRASPLLRAMHVKAIQRSILRNNNLQT